MEKIISKSKAARNVLANEKMNIGDVKGEVTQVRDNGFVRFEGKTGENHIKVWMHYEDARAALTIADGSTADDAKITTKGESNYAIVAGVLVAK